MINSRRFLSISTVRNTTNVIGKLNFWINLLLIINIIRTIHITKTDLECSFQSNTTFGDTRVDYYIASDKLQYEKIITALAILFIITLMLYVNYHLSSATIKHEVCKVHQWLMIHSITLVFFVIFLLVPTFVIPNPIVFIVATIVSLIFSLEIYIVVCFYDDELELLATMHNRNISTIHPYNNQPIVSTMNCTVEQSCCIQRSLQQNQQTQCSRPPRYFQQSDNLQPHISQIGGVSLLSHQLYNRTQSNLPAPNAPLVEYNIPPPYSP
ncbi:uncharacterized protein LOC126905219 [Daktulosphaira vitifoliae]|uniref:uncharacterized protein LOC126905219 n=1 Tax=Daktulosphaira vitifoliae TaxID=58002 RepID=UPI0021AAF1B7|nr:uncharacterized protein LOC126905219 [Daktulosphaira vitifoliae]